MARLVSAAAVDGDDGDADGDNGNDDDDAICGHGGRSGGA